MTDEDYDNYFNPQARVFRQIRARYRVKNTINDFITHNELTVDKLNAMTHSDLDDLIDADALELSYERHYDVLLQCMLRESTVTFPACFDSGFSMIDVIHHYLFNKYFIADDFVDSEHAMYTYFIRYIDRYFCAPTTDAYADQEYLKLAMSNIQENALLSDLSSLRRMLIYRDFSLLTKSAAILQFFKADQVPSNLRDVGRYIIQDCLSTCILVNMFPHLLTDATVVDIEKVYWLRNRFIAAHDVDGVTAIY